MRGRLVLIAVICAASNADARGLTGLLHREASILTELSQLNGQVVAVVEQLDDLQQEQTQLSYQISEARRRIKALERRSSERRGHLGRRVRGLYKLSRGGMPRLVLEGNGQRSDLAARISAARLILRRDVRELALYQRERQRVEKERRQLAHQLDSSERVRRQLAQRRQQLEQTQQTQVQTLQRMRRSRRTRTKLAEQLNRQQRRLMRQIGELSYQIHKKGGFASRRGRLKRPVKGPVVGVFGHKLATKGRRRLEVVRHGISFRPRSGARVKSVAAGRVRMAGPLAGYGNVVLIQHNGGYFTLYGHLGRLKVEKGQKARAGQTIGRAGIDPLTGKRAAYFEIRRGERALDPIAWLRR